MLVFITFIITCLLISLIILAATYFINLPKSYYQKRSSYECGFEPFGDARSFFDVQFYAVGLIFILFDLEIVFLVPFQINIILISFFNYLIMLTFMGVVIVGFYYELSTNLLN